MSYETIRILLVDDFDLGRERIRGVLVSLGVQPKNIEEADDGLGALNLLQSSVGTPRAFQVIFSDWNMPVMSGLELLKECRKDNTLMNIHFVMVSSEGDQKAVVEALHEGANDYIVKPVSNEEVRLKIEKALKRS